MTAIPETDSFVARADRAVREGARPTIGGDSSPDDMAAAFAAAGEVAQQRAPQFQHAAYTAAHLHYIRRAATARDGRVRLALLWGEVI